jgi:UrcA family protein
MAFLRTIVLAMASTALVLAAEAQDYFGVTRTAHVAYLDLNLQSKAGQATLQRRIQAAVRRVCPGRPLPNELAQMARFKACRKAAMDGVAPVVAALAEGRPPGADMITLAAAAPR